MPKPGRQALADALRTEPPAGLSGLDDEGLSRLAVMVRSARAAQARELQESLQAAVAHLPRPLRGPVRKLFGL